MQTPPASPGRPIEASHLGSGRNAVTGQYGPALVNGRDKCTVTLLWSQDRPDRIAFHITPAASTAKTGGGLWFVDRGVVRSGGDFGNAQVRHDLDQSRLTNISATRYPFSDTNAACPWIDIDRAWLAEFVAYTDIYSEPELPLDAAFDLTPLGEEATR